MTHPTPWQLELFALGEDVPEVRSHLPCAVCASALLELTADPGPVPPSIVDAVRPRPVSALPSLVGTAIVAAGLVLGLTVWFVPWERTPSAPSPAEDVVSPPAPAVRSAPASESTAPLAEVEPVTVTEPEAPLSVSLAVKGSVYTPSWSPDGRHLAFELTNHDDRSDLMLVPVSGLQLGAPERVLLSTGTHPEHTPPVLLAPVWHPDGSMIFEGSSLGGPFRLYYTMPGAPAALLGTPEWPGVLSSPALSPDGQRLAFIAGQGELFIRATATELITRLTHSEAPEGFPTFTQTGVAFTRRAPDGNHDVYEIQEGGETMLVGGPGEQTRPVAAGKGLVYFDNSDDPERWDLRSVQDAEVRTLAEDVRLPLRARPAVSPDGEWVAYGSEDPAQSGSLWLVRVDGSERLEVPVGLFEVGEPDLTGNGLAPGLRAAFTARTGPRQSERTLHVTPIDLTEGL